MTTYFEVRTSTKLDWGGGIIFVSSRHLTFEDAEKAALDNSRSGIFSWVWQVRELTSLSKGGPPYLVTDYLCEYAPAEVAA